MYHHIKKLMYAARVDEPNPEFGNMLFGLLVDLQELAVLASESHLTLTVVRQAALALRDQHFLDVCDHLKEQTERQQAWLLTHVKHRAAHTLVVPA
jgi:hypothetical protein